MNTDLLLGAAGLLAGTLNALAGGGSFVSFPALVFAGVPSVMANASSSVALYPGSAATAWALRDRLQSLDGIALRHLVWISCGGGLLGAVLLLLTPDLTLNRIMPWLLLLGTLAFAFGRNVGTALRQWIQIGPRTLLAGQFVLAIYGGYFGGVVGLMMMAVWSLYGASDLHRMIAVKALLVGASNTAAILVFICADSVRWRETLIMAACATVGGYAGGRLSGYIPALWIRAGINSSNVVMTLMIFWRLFLSR